MLLGLQGGDLFHQQPGLREHAAGGGARVRSTLPPCQFSARWATPCSCCLCVASIPHIRQALMKRGQLAGQVGCSQLQNTSSYLYGARLVFCFLRPSDCAITTQGSPSRTWVDKHGRSNGGRTSMSLQRRSSWGNLVGCLHPTRFPPPFSNCLQNPCKRQDIKEARRNSDRLVLPTTLLLPLVPLNCLCKESVVGALTTLVRQSRHSALSLAYGELGRGRREEAIS